MTESIHEESMVVQTSSKSVLPIHSRPPVNDADETRQNFVE
jgi:hypothetical protein